MKKILFLLFFSNSIFAAELHGPHTHGEMELLILWEHNNLQVTFVGSAKDLIGYERNPKTAREKKALRNFDEKYDPFKMISVNPEASCEFLQGRSASDMFSAMPHKDGFFGKTHTHNIGVKGHIDFRIQYQYECQSKPELRFHIFELAPSIKKLNIHESSIDGTIITTLTKNNNTYLVE